MALQAVLSQYFLSPIGLAGLAALIPLAVFYLTRPEPKRRTMPSMAFFMEEKQSGKLEQALTVLKQNLFLLLHVLFIATLAAALANPYIQDGARAGHAVLVLDRSASMADDMDAAKSFLTEHLAKQNTVVLVGEDVTVPLTGAGPGQVKQWMRGVSPRDVETDIVAGLELARDYNGHVAVASDLDQSTSDRPVKPVLASLSAGRDVAVMEAARENRFGIVDIVPGRKNATVTVQNVMDEEGTVTVSAGDAREELDIPAGATRSVTVSVDPGKNVVRISDDPIPADNRAYLSVPSDRQVDVVFIADQPNPYLEKAIDLIPFTALRTVRPPVQGSLNGDIYVVGETTRLLSRTIRDLEEQVRVGGKDLVVFGQATAFDRFSTLPVERTGGARNVSVSLSFPRRIHVDRGPVIPVNRTRGTALATHDAVVKAGHGRGEIVYYGLKDTGFRYDFLYPIFWKALFADLAERPTPDDLHRRTGTVLNASRTITPRGETVTGAVTLDRAGFYNASHLYAANLVSIDESLTEDVTVEEDAAAAEARVNRPLQGLLTVVLAGLAAAEFGALLYLGVI